MTTSNYLHAFQKKNNNIFSADNVRNQSLAAQEKLQKSAVFEENFVSVKNESVTLGTSGMTMYVSCDDTTIEKDLCVMDTVLNLPRTHSDNLNQFAVEFSNYLVENEIFHPDDVPPEDPSVFYMLLDRYVLLLFLAVLACDKLQN